MLFIPEEEHGASREADIVPPVVRRHGEVYDPRGAAQAAITHLQGHAAPAVAARRGDQSIRPQRGGNAQSVPDTDGPIPLFSGTDAEA